MPVVIYIFTLCAFAIGFTEFISIGLAESLQASTANVGLAVTLYATGVVIGAPVLTALASHCSRKRRLLVAMLAFTASNVLAALSTHLPLLLAARLLSGLVHGVFFAVASSVATRLVARERAGAALSLVFGGVTVAMAQGVPAGTWLGSVLPWQWIFALITPLLLQVTHTDIRGASAILLAYGMGAAIGNVVGGRMTDRIGMDRASLWLLTGIAAVLALIGLAQDRFAFMVVLVMALGLTTYGAIPPLQSRILGLARRHRPQALDVASGLNIAAFNAGVVAGSMLGAASLEQ